MPNIGDSSVFKKIEVQTERIDQHDEKLDEYGKRIDTLEKSDEKMFEEIAKLKDGFTKVENVIWSSAKETRDTFTTQNKLQWDLITALSEGKREERKDRHELNKTKVEKYSEIIMKVGGAGGILIILAQLIFG